MYQIVGKEFIRTAKAVGICAWLFFQSPEKNSTNGVLTAKLSISLALNTILRSHHPIFSMYAIQCGRFFLPFFSTLQRMYVHIYMYIRSNKREWVSRLAVAHAVTQAHTLFLSRSLSLTLHTVNCVALLLGYSHCPLTLTVYCHLRWSYLLKARCIYVHTHIRMRLYDSCSHFIDQCRAVTHKYIEFTCTYTCMYVYK